MTIRLILSILFITITSIIYGQFLEDNFSDNDISSNPTWNGDIINFTVNNEQLQLDAPDGGSSSLSSEFSLGDSSTWEFWFNMDFSPSATNYLEIYLLSTTNDLTNSDAFLLRMGENGSDDAIRLIKRIAGVETELAVSTLGLVSNNPSISISSLLDKDNNWTFSFNDNSGNGFQDLFNTTISELIDAPNLFFGLSCYYTTTRKDKFSFDDIKVGAILPDTQNPEIIDMIVNEPSIIRLFFNETILESSVGNAIIEWNGTYTGNSTINFDINNPTELLLNLDPELKSPTNYHLSISGLSDFAGNTMLPFDSTFSYLIPEKAEQYDIIITEIMADPSPAIGMPETEYIELYNRSNKTIDLVDYIISSGSSTDILSSYILKPQEYVLLIDRDDESDFDFVINKILIDGLFTLSNNGDDITLFNNDNEPIHAIDYTIHWYNNLDRNDGGYSLEMISFDNVCQSISNWSACSNLSGGTPGKINSVFDNIGSPDGPQLVSIITLGADSLFLIWDRNIDKSNIDLDQFTIENLSIIEVITEGSDDNQIKLLLENEMNPRQIYRLVVLENFLDCIGNINPEYQEKPFAIPENAEPGDLVINEVLPDPYVGGADFIEIYNLSNKVISFENMAFRNEQNDQTVRIEIDGSIFPGEYFVFSDNINSITNEYFVQNKEWLINSDIPSLNNDNGNIQLGYINLFGLDLIDEMNYNTDMHSQLLDDPEGVSLEKIRSDQSGLDEENWHSASASSGFATPTFKNSQALDTTTPSEAEIQLSSNRVSPDNDGFEDFVLVNYNLNKAGYKANVKIFSDKGQEIYTISTDLLLSTQGTLKWEGINDEGLVPPLGIYIFAIELIHPDGDIIHKTLPCILASKF